MMNITVTNEDSVLIQFETDVITVGFKLPDQNVKMKTFNIKISLTYAGDMDIITEYFDENDVRENLYQQFNNKILIDSTEVDKYNTITDDFNLMTAVSQDFKYLGTLIIALLTFQTPIPDDSDVSVQFIIKN